MTRRSLLCSLFLFSLVWTPDSLVGSMPGGNPDESHLLKPETGPLPLSFDVKMPNTKIGPGDDLVVEGKLKNLSDKDKPYYPTAKPALQFHHQETKQVWVTQASLFPPPPGAPPSLAFWKAKEETPFTIRLSPQTKFAPASARPEAARIGLPPGKYRLYVRMRYIDHYPEWKKGALDGELSPPPIEFEVVK